MRQHGRNVRQALFRFVMVTIAVSLIFTFTPPASAADDRTIFVNLSDTTAYLAIYEYQPYRPYRSSLGGGGGGYSLPAIQPEQQEGWSFKGWYSIAPGEFRSYHTSRSRAYYIKRNGRQITWSDKTEVGGYILNGSAFGIFWERSTSNIYDIGQGSQLSRRSSGIQGLERVTFQKFGAGHFTISGNAYRLTNQTFNYDIQSREGKYFTRNFDIPGSVRVMDFSYSATSRWAENASWSIPSRSRVSLTVYVSGRQQRPGAGRTPGYYRGWVKVHYIVPNR